MRACRPPLTWRLLLPLSARISACDFVASSLRMGISDASLQRTLRSAPAATGKGARTSADNRRKKEAPSDSDCDFQPRTAEARCLRC